MSIRNYSNTTPATVLTATLQNTAGSTAIQVGSTASYPTPPFIAGIERGTTNEEVVEVTATVDGTHFTATRGFDSTPINTHDGGAPFEHCSAAIDYREPNLFINLIQNAGDIIVGGSGGAASQLPIGTSGYALVSNGAGAAPSWQQVIAPGVCAHTAATSAPPGWLIRNGATLSTTTYAALFAQLGYTYGGSGSSFALPNALNTVDLGGGAGSSYPLGSTGGAASVSLSSSQLPTHTHGVNEGAGHYHNAPPNNNFAVEAVSTIGFTNVGAVNSQNISYSARTGTNTTGITIANAGSSSPVNTLPPYQALTPIIKF